MDLGVGALLWSVAEWEVAKYFSEKFYHVVASENV